MEEIMEKRERELVKIVTNEEGEATVRGRDLHAALEVPTQYNHWIERMIDYGFQSEKDFWTFLTESTGGRPSTEHALSLDMAKEIAMLQRTERGKQVRQYFIAVEKKWRRGNMNVPTTITADLLEQIMLRMRALEQENAAAAPKVAYFDTLVDRALLTNIRDTAKELHIRETEFIDTLLSRKYLYRDAKGQLKPYSQYTMSGEGLFDIKEWVARHSDKTGNQTLITPKGRETFRLLLHQPRLLESAE